MGTTTCFQISKDETSSQSRALKFKDEDGVNREFKNKIANMIAYKQYLDQCQKKGQRLDPQIVDFLCDSFRTHLEMVDRFLNEDHIVRFVFGEAALAQNHPNITRLTLVNCGLSDDSLETILHGLMNAGQAGV